MSSHIHPCNYNRSTSQGRLQNGVVPNALLYAKSSNIILRQLILVEQMIIISVWNISKASGMTYILGVSCSDGVVLIADRRITIDGGIDYTYGDKLFGDLGGIIIGFSGSKSTFELFRTDIIEYVNDYKKTYREGVSLHKIILQISDISYKLNNKYRGVDESFDILLAISGTQLPTLHSSLRYFYQDGKLETVIDYKAIGTASPYGSIYLKQNWSPQITMNQGALLGHFIIKFIETFQLDLSVGNGTGDAQVWFIPNNYNDYQATPKILEDLNTLTNKKIDDFKRQNMAKVL